MNLKFLSILNSDTVLSYELSENIKILGVGLVRNLDHTAFLILKSDNLLPTLREKNIYYIYYNIINIYYNSLVKKNWFLIFNF